MITERSLRALAQTSKSIKSSCKSYPKVYNRPTMGRLVNILDILSLEL